MNSIGDYYENKADLWIDTLINKRKRRNKNETLRSKKKKNK